MPSGYTSSIQDGITFENFAMKCARSFGACIEMRDDPLDKEIPNGFKPRTYHSKEIKRLKAEAAKIGLMSLEDAYNVSVTEYEQTLVRLKRGKESDLDLLKKYNSMLEQVEAWDPPTKDHVELKSFMASQIKESIRFDCSTGYYDKEIANLTLLSPQEWLEKEKTKIWTEITYHTKEHKKDVARAKDRTTWVRQLRKSLGL